MTGYIHQNTGTATDLLRYQYYSDSSGVQHLTRVQTSDQEWVVRDWDGERYVIRFDKNFTKKHLFTFSKREADVSLAAFYESLAHEDQSPEYNWMLAEHKLLYEKLIRTTRARASGGQAGRCSFCKHAGSNHGGFSAGVATAGACGVADCPCVRFEDFAVRRTAQGKPEANPLAGAVTKKNTCIIMNYVPKAEFENVVCQSIQAHEKPPGWQRGDPLAKGVGDEATLRWDFGAARFGSVVFVDNTNLSAPIFTRRRGVEVVAKKKATDWQVQTWEIVHLHGDF